MEEEQLYILLGLCLVPFLALVWALCSCNEESEESSTSEDPRERQSGDWEDRGDCCQLAAGCCLVLSELDCDGG